MRVIGDAREPEQFSTGNLGDCWQYRIATLPQLYCPTGVPWIYILQMDVLDPVDVNFNNITVTKHARLINTTAHT